MAYKSPAKIPVKIPTRFNCQEDVRYASETRAHPARLRIMARIFTQFSVSCNSQRPNSAVNAAELYTRTVAMDAPFKATDKVQEALNIARTIPNIIKYLIFFQLTLNNPGLNIRKKPIRVRKTNTARQKASTIAGS